MAKQASLTKWALEPYGIGMKLRALRNTKRLTLSRLAAETGLSTALLSKLETERMIPTLPTLATICRVYGVNLSYFFQEPENHVLAITRRVHLETTVLRPEGVRTIPLNAPQQGPRIEAQMVELSSGSYAPDESSEGLCAFVYVLEGQLQMTSNGMVQTLEQGDCAYMETRLPASWKSATEARCRILVLRPGSAVPAAAAEEVA